jgi:hypothetical protein
MYSSPMSCWIRQLFEFSGQVLEARSFELDLDAMRVECREVMVEDNALSPFRIT